MRFCLRADAGHGIPMEIYNPDTPCPGCYRGDSRLLAYESKGPDYDRLMAKLVIIAGRSPKSVQMTRVGDRFVIDWEPGRDIRDAPLV